MAEARGADTWTEELATLIDDSLLRYAGDPLRDDVDVSSTTESFHVTRSAHAPAESRGAEPESLKEQAVGFAVAWFEILVELARGCGDILRQNLVNEDSYVVRKLRGPCGKVSKRLRFLNEFVPEDRDPVHAWSVVLFVFVLALAGFFNQEHSQYFN